MVLEEKLSIGGKTSWDKVLFSFQQSQIANDQTTNTGFPAFFILKR